MVGLYAVLFYVYGVGSYIAIPYEDKIHGFSWNVLKGFVDTLHMD